LKAQSSSAFRELSATCRALYEWPSFRLRLFFEGILVGLLTGFVIGAFIMVLNEMSVIRHYFFDTFIIPGFAEGHMLPLAGWVVFAIFLSYVIYRLCIHETMAMGGGIPQVKGILLGVMHMRWLPVLWVKFTGVALGILGGLSIGREAPSVQMGAAVAQGLSRFFHRIPMEEKYLITSGSSAGLAAAFSAPLAGTMFAMEEMNRNFSSAALLPAMASAVTAVLVTKYVFGLGAIFVFPAMPASTEALILPLIVAAVICGFAGVFYNYGLTHIGRFYHALHLRGVWPRLVFALLAAIVVAFTLPDIAEGGDELVNAIVRNRPALSLLCLLLLGKFFFTILSTGSGIPGGFLVPMFTLGALLGAVESDVFIRLGFMDPVFSNNIITIAMSAFVTASVRSPFTAILLILELTGDFNHLLALTFSSAIAFVVSGLIGGQPIYSELLSIALSGHAAPRHEDRTLVEVAVAPGSYLDNRTVSELHLPHHAVLVEIKTDQDAILPSPQTKILAGMHLFILTYASLSEEIIALGESSIPNNEKGDS
jgi:H+/Cl- antiporter ClcA